MGDRAVHRREELAQRGFELREDLLIGVEPRLDRGAEVIRRAATAEGDAIVARALAVDDEVTIVGEGLVVGEADLVPEVAARAVRSRSSSEYSGTTVRRSRGRFGVKPSVARTTKSACTFAPTVTTSA